MCWFSSIRWAMADQGQELQRPPRRVLFLGHSFVSRFQRHCDTRRIYNVGLDPQLISFVAMGRPGAYLSFARDVIHDDDSSSCISTTDCLILQIGENDINSLSCEPIQLARNILRVALDCLDRGNVDFICICQLMYRAAPSSSSSWSAARHPLRFGYNDLMDVNRELRRLIFFFPRIHLGKHHGMLLYGCSLPGAGTLTPGAPASIPFHSWSRAISAKRQPAVELSTHCIM